MKPKLTGKLPAGELPQCWKVCVCVSGREKGINVLSRAGLCTLQY